MHMPIHEYGETISSTHTHKQAPILPLKNMETSAYTFGGDATRQCGKLVFSSLQERLGLGKGSSFCTIPCSDH